MVRCIVASLDENSSDGDLTRTQRRWLRQYMDALDQSKRRIFELRMSGRTPAEIGRELGMEADQVCRALATVYADLRVQGQS